MAGLLFIWTPWIRYDGSRLMPAFRASRSRFLAEPPLGEPQPRDIDIDPLAHHSGGRLSYLRLLSLIATARWPRASADSGTLTTFTFTHDSTSAFADDETALIGHNDARPHTVDAMFRQNRGGYFGRRRPKCLHGSA